MAVVALHGYPAAGAEVESTTGVISGAFWHADESQWGDGRNMGTPSPKNRPGTYKLSYRITVPKDGWYELYLRGANTNLHYDVLLDGKGQPYFLRPDKGGKVGNLWLSKGDHVLTVQRLGRVGFPTGLFDRFELIPSGGRPNACVFAEKTKVDVLRAGEKLVIEVTGGGTSRPVTYTLLRADLAHPKMKPVAVGKVRFDAGSKAVTKTVEIDCPEEGAFSLGAEADGKPLSHSEFNIGEYAVVDVNHVQPASGKTEVIADIDCVEQTIDGEPVTKETFIEANGPTRVTTTALGAYRESHDCTPPEAEVPTTVIDVPRSFSGFSYRVSLPKTQVPYLVEVEFPDNTRRAVAIIANWVDEDRNLLKPYSGYEGKSYETGGRFALSGKMQTHRAVRWARSKVLLLSIMSQQPGTRAAAARIRVLRFDGDRIPAKRLDSAGKRDFINWFEEGVSWEKLVGIVGLRKPAILRDMIGMNRWARLVQFYGGNGIQAMGVAYQSAFWRCRTLDGFYPDSYDKCRLLTLICEKYGMRHMVEFFPNQSYFTKVKIPSVAERPEDAKPTSINGLRLAAGAHDDINALHPGVQQVWIDAAREIHDKLADSPAFAGVTVRADQWMFHGDFMLPSLYWGYNNWTTHQFEADTGVKVPGDDEDPDRFMKRFKFLTAPDMKDRWIRWRCERILDYHKRLRDALRGDRKDVVFGLTGDFVTDRVYDLPEDLMERAREAGVDLQARRDVEGLVMMPGARYGSRNTSMRAQEAYGGFLDRDNVQVGVGEINSFAAYMIYLELGTHWPAERLGVVLDDRHKGKPPYFCSASLAAGPASLEKFAVVLADQDTMVFRDGGNADTFGDPACWKPWFGTFCSLPKLHFHPMTGASDPVAVWHRNVTPDEAPRDVRPGHYVYLVNRAPYAVPVTMKVGAKRLHQLGVERDVPITDGQLKLDVPPYWLLAYRAPLDAALGEVTMQVTPDQMERVRERLAFAQRVKDKLAGPAGAAVGEPEKQAFLNGLENAWQAMGENRPWRALTELSRPDMMRVYGDLAEIPVGQIVTRFPGLMQGQKTGSHYALLSPMLSVDDLVVELPDDTRPDIKPSDAYNPDWRGAKVLASKDGVLKLTLDIPAEGPYAIQLGQIAPTPGLSIGSINGKQVDTPVVTRTPGVPETHALPILTLKQGKAELVLQRRGGEFGVYGVKVLPVLRSMPSVQWSTVGPFKNVGQMDLLAGKSNKLYDFQVQRTFEREYPPEKDPSLSATYQTVDGRRLHWRQDDGTVRGRHHSLGIDMPLRTGSANREVNFAQCFIHSDRDRTVALYLPVDWWARAYLNGKRVRTNIDPKMAAEGYDFNTHYPTFFGVLHLKKGSNRLLVKQLGGSLGSRLVGYITDDAGITVTPTPAK